MTEPTKPDYKKLFDPTAAVVGADPPTTQTADRRDGRVYVYTDAVVLAVNVALATGRPLLVLGEPGSGKSSLAANAARWLGRRYLEHVISSRTSAQDLLWTTNTLQRLSDASQGQVKGGDAYLEPGVLWWAFDPESAGAYASKLAVHYGWSGGEQADPSRPAVVLLDEIDKAEPDVPNDLLVPLGAGEFGVWLDKPPVRWKAPPLVIITSNRERELPNAFVRRCIVLPLPSPDADRLVTIAEAHFGGTDPLFRRIATEIIAMTSSQGTTRAVNAAEYLDAVRACKALDIDLDKAPSLWNAIADATLTKRQGERLPV
jgi:MoxR-like ATPase